MSTRRETDAQSSPKRLRTLDTSPRSEASLLGLPIELRTLIYEFVLGRRLIHITTRPCQPYDKGSFRPEPRPSSWAPVSRAWKKWTHTVCQLHVDWQQAYEVSKHVPRPSQQDTDTQSTHGEPLLQEYVRHDVCNWIQDDFQDRRYNIRCTHSTTIGHRPHDCDEQDEMSKEMNRIFGPPEKGLERAHSSSRLSLDILLACRQIYREAALLPYSTNVFHFEFPATLGDFVKQALIPSQSAAMKSLQAISWPLGDLKDAVVLLPGLKYLQYICIVAICAQPQRSLIVKQQEDPRCLKPDIARVEAMFSCVSVHESCRRHNLAEWRKHAERLEEVLSRNKNRSP